tara:strand:- start:2427 stop:2531 length:105 start_codon:yes stop_codon:yes gene_type:complete
MDENFCDVADVSETGLSSSEMMNKNNKFAVDQAL